MVPLAPCRGYNDQNAGGQAGPTATAPRASSAEFSWPGSVNSGLPSRATRRQKALFLLACAAWATKTASGMPAARYFPPGVAPG
jgi:hypothetical protein